MRYRYLYGGYEHFVEDEIFYETIGTASGKCKWIFFKVAYTHLSSYWLYIFGCLYSPLDVAKAYIITLFHECGVMHGGFLALPLLFIYVGYET